MLYRFKLNLTFKGKGKNPAKLKLFLGKKLVRFGEISGKPNVIQVRWVK